MILYLSRYLAGLLAVCHVSNTVGNSIFTQNLMSDGSRSCGAPMPTENDIAQSMRAMEKWLNTPKSARIMTVTVPTVFHTIRDGAEGAMTEQEIDQTINVLNTGFNGNFIFNLIDKTDTDNSAWYSDSSSEMDMKSSLHQGGCDTLNIYSTSGYGFLGFAYFPNGCQWDLNRDGVVIASSSKPGGSFPYDEGKTLTHEVGHWLGLYHTFEYGCEDPGDLIDDTPAHNGPDFACDNTLDTCTSPGKNPIENFMNYTPDACMTQFSADQFTRMLAEWNAYREGTGEPNQPVTTPTNPPGTTPTDPPVTTPSDSPVASECPSQTLTVLILLDGWASETSWSVVYTSDGAEIMSGSNYDVPNVEVSKSACVDVNLGCMTLTVNDSFGDGIILSNAIKVNLDGTEIYNSGPMLSFFTLTAYLGLGTACDGYTLPPAPLPPTAPTTTPSSEPTNVVCGSNEDELMISIRTDNFPYEISWNLVYSSDETVIMTGSNYEEVSQQYTAVACVDSDQCMTLTVMDSFGDGITGTEDVIRAVLNDVEIYNYGPGDDKPFSTLIVDLGLCGETPTSLPVLNPTKAPVLNPTEAPVQNPTSAPVPDPTESPVPDPTDPPLRNPSIAPVPDPTESPVPDPTIAPVHDPTKAPVRNPTKSPVPDPTKAPTGSISCKKKKSLLEIYMTTDDNGNENKITVKKQKKNKKGWAKKKFVDEKDFPSNDLTVIEECLSKNKCYQVKITDSGKDGICCEVGNGSVRIVWDGFEVVDTKFKSGKKKIVEVNCDP